MLSASSVGFGGVDCVGVVDEMEDGCAGGAVDDGDCAASAIDGGERPTAPADFFSLAPSLPTVMAALKSARRCFSSFSSLF